MPANTPVYGFPYPTGTDRVMDGDNAIGALALAVEVELTARMARVLGYGQAIANQGPFTAAVALTGLSVGPITLPAGRRIRVSVHSNWLASTAGNISRVRIRDNGANVHLAGIPVPVPAQLTALHTAAILSPAAGAHTFDCTGELISGTGSVTLGAAASYPAWLLVEDIGPQPVARADTTAAPDSEPAI
jgi:hypothetical protein